MHLYGSPASPFVQRCAIVARAKGHDIAIQPPPGGSFQSPEFQAISPMGRIPILALDDGGHICESAAIAAYLDETLDGPSLLPGEPRERARIREIEALTTCELAAALRPFMIYRIFRRGEDEAVVAAANAQAIKGCEALAQVMGDTPFAAGNDLSMADAALVPLINLMRIIAMAPEISALLERFAFLGHYCDRAIANSEVVARSIIQMSETFAAIFERMKQPEQS